MEIYRKFNPNISLANLSNNRDYLALDEIRFFAKCLDSPIKQRLIRLFIDINYLNEYYHILFLVTNDIPIILFCYQCKLSYY